MFADISLQSLRESGKDDGPANTPVPGDNRIRNIHRKT